MSEVLPVQEKHEEKAQDIEEDAERHLQGSPLLDRKPSVQESSMSDNEVFADAVEAHSSHTSEGQDGAVTVDDRSPSKSSDSPPAVVSQQSSKQTMDDRPNAPPQVNGVKQPRRSSLDVDPEAQAMVIGSLRAQVQDLFSQVTQLNNKLVQSYDRVSDLEDGLHMTSSNLRASSLKVSQLELERTQHLAALNTGLLVERTHVTAELTRLMEKATEEAARRGQAESARAEIEKDLDDLSASLFGQANTMVAEARLAQAASERKVEDAEQALKGAEEAVTAMQQQIQAMQEEKERAVASAEQMHIRMGKGKWVERDKDPSGTHPSSRLLSVHTPYQEFLLFVAHLRSTRPASPTPPSISSLLPLPFIARLVTEDTEPTLRFDVAPSLNWLSRRTVLSAIHNGQLSIEPMSTNTLLQEAPFPSPGLPGSSSHSGVSCALCGTCIISSHTDPSHLHSKSPQHNKPSLSLARANTTQSIPSSWSSFLPKNPLSSATASAPPTPPGGDHIMPGLHVRSSSQPLPQSHSPTQIYVFRIATQTSSSLPGGQTSLTISARSGNPTVYPLCQSSWCLSRLRTTCSLWSFVKSGVVDRVWEEEVPAVAETGWEIVGGKDGNTKDSGARSAEKPPVPPRRRGLWERASSMASSALGNSIKEREREEKKLPATPPPNLSPSTPTSPRPRPPLPARSKSRFAPSPTQEVVVASDRDVNSNHAAVDELATSGQPSQDVAVSSDSKSKPDESPNGADENQDVTVVPSTFAATQPTTSDADALAGSTIPAAEGGHVRGIPETTADSSIATETYESLRVPSTEELSATETPAAPTVLSSVQEAEKPPSRAGSPAPPPLPRRAAARARPVSVLIPAAATGENNAAMTPRQTEASPADASQQPTTETDSAPSSEPKSVEENTISLSQESEPEADAKRQEELENAESPEPPASDLQDIDHSFSVKQEQSTTPDNPEQPVDSEPAPISIAEAPIPIESPAQKPDAPRDSELASPVEAGDANEPTDEDQHEGVEETGPFIGDATWEERTWKEIVRLREDMFWARIGCVR
ncbi:hypothetical protein NEOLEDRAFT_1149156 [Neolentinus lepideus HHB14362 ss-1]|uniref:GDP/GTP exchange factor Sec2 N-terminal domain-containing protein n=1 Tax=Neolentinus lepideus HHB14362 ss-1 TaxID=1314782 RepID=A0A165RCU5_9AGAM|nr:hypothetical protein NEOLEDRAFT_1149156 [Neolentinus lepideus HHB14362 ss-1]